MRLPKAIPAIGNGHKPVRGSDGPERRVKTVGRGSALSLLLPTAQKQIRESA